MSFLRVGLISLCYSLILANPHQDVLDWWTRMSVQKPVKCAVNPEFLLDFPPVAKDLLKNHDYHKIMDSHTCSSGEIKLHYFKGQVINGELEGTGKLKWSTMGSDNATKCFYRRASFKGSKVKEIVGTFKHSEVIGTAKFIFENNYTLIANFEQNVQKGLVRHWNGKHELSELFYEDLKRKGRTWLRYDHYLVWADYGFVKQSIDEPSTILIPLDTESNPLIGTFDRNLEFIENLHSVEIQISNPNDCSLNLKWTVGEKLNYKIHLPSNQKISDDFRQHQNCQFNSLQEKSDLEEQFVAWNEFMYEYYKIQNLPFLNIFHVKPEISPLEPEKVKLPFLSKIEIISEKHLWVKMSIWNGPIQVWKVNMMSIDENGDLHGAFAVELPNEEDHGKSGSIPNLDWSPKIISGNFVHGKLNGIVMILTYKLQAIFAMTQDNVFHGPCYVMGLASILEMESRGFKQDKNKGFHPGNGFIGRFKNGQIYGDFWIGMLQHGAYLHGKVDEHGNFTGDNLAYIYPDGVTAYKGRFENKFMKRAFNVDVQAYECNEDGLLVVKSYSEPLSDQVFKYDPCTNHSFGGGAPLGLRDPYEVKTVKLAPSSQPNSGEGVFLIRDMPRLRFACMYSLFLYSRPIETSLYKAACAFNETKSEDYRRHCKKYSLGISSYHGVIDLPPEFDVNPLPNLGPKVNHHFRANNSAYSEIEHPRWGLIQSVTLQRDMKAGEELFTHYGYEAGHKFPEDFPWYWDTLETIEKEEKKQKEAENAKVAKKKKKPKKNSKVK